MRIEEIAISNFRGIKNQTIVFDGKSTVFFGVNGTGKSTILRAINVMFSRIVQKIVQSRYKQTINMTKEDIRFGKLFEIDEALGEGYKQTFGYSVIQVPDQKLILD